MQPSQNYLCIQPTPQHQWSVVGHQKRSQKVPITHQNTHTRPNWSIAQHPLSNESRYPMACIVWRWYWTNQGYHSPICHTYRERKLWSFRDCILCRTMQVPIGHESTILCRLECRWATKGKCMLLPMDFHDMDMPWETNPIMPIQGFSILSGPRRSMHPPMDEEWALHCHGDGGLCEDVVYYLINFYRDETLVTSNGYQCIVTRWSSSCWINRDPDSLGIDGIGAWLIEHDIQITRSEGWKWMSGMVW